MEIITIPVHLKFLKITIKTNKQSAFLLNCAFSMETEIIRIGKARPKLKVKMKMMNHN